MDQLKVFVGGLSQHTTRDSLNAHFQQFGQADSFVMMDKGTGRSRGFGFVNFTDRAVLAHVLQNQHEVDGVLVTCSPYQSPGDRGGCGGGSLFGDGGALDATALLPYDEGALGMAGAFDHLAMHDGRQLGAGSDGAGGAYEPLPMVPPASASIGQEVGGSGFGCSVVQHHMGGHGGIMVPGGCGGLSKPVAARDQMKIFIGGLSQQTTKESLDAYFNQFGYADSFIMVDKATGRSRGFGFVNFHDESVMNTILQSQHEVDGVPVTSRAYTDKKHGSSMFGCGGGGGGMITPPSGGGSSRGGGGGLGPNPATLALNNLANTLSPQSGGEGAGGSEGALTQLLQQPAIISLLQKVQAQANQLINQTSPQAQPQSAHHLGQSGGGSMHGGGAGGGPPLLKIFVGGLAQHTTKDSLNTYFSQFGHADSIIMMDRATGRSRGFGFVDFQDDQVMTAVLGTSHQVDGVVVTCSAYAGKSSPGPSFQPIPGFQPVGPASGKGSVDVQSAAADILNNTVELVAKLQGDFAGGHASGLEGELQIPGPQELGASGPEWTPELGTEVVPAKLFVGGLDQSVTLDMLYTAFDKYGPCECEVVMDKFTGRSRGFGFVQYSTEASAVAAWNAVHSINGRRVEVSECWGKGSGRGKSHRSSPY